MPSRVNVYLSNESRAALDALVAAGVKPADLMRRAIEAEIERLKATVQSAPAAYFEQFAGDEISVPE